MSLSHSNWKLAAALATVALASPAFADLIVNTNLGNVGAGAVPFSGTTVGQANDADTYSPPGNTAAIWDQDFVYQFTTAQSFEDACCARASGACVEISNASRAKEIGFMMFSF